MENYVNRELVYKESSGAIRSAAMTVFYHGDLIDAVRRTPVFTILQLREKIGMELKIFMITRYG